MCAFLITGLMSSFFAKKKKVHFLVVLVLSLAMETLTHNCSTGDVFHATVSRLSALAVSTGIVLKHFTTVHIPQAINLPYQPLLIKPIFSVLAHAEKQFPVFQRYFTTVFSCSCTQETCDWECSRSQIFSNYSKLLLILLLSRKAYLIDFVYQRKRIILANLKFLFDRGDICKGNINRRLYIVNR